MASVATDALSQVFLKSQREDRIYQTTQRILHARFRVLTKLTVEKIHVMIKTVQ